MALSKRRKIQRLLNTETLGDRKPSQLLRYMRSLAGDTNDNIIRHIFFLQRMPPIIQTIQATIDKDVTLDKAAEVADQIMEYSFVYTTMTSSTTVQENS